MKKIDSLKPGTIVKLRFCGSKSLGNAPYEEDAVFQGITGEGDDRRAKFTLNDESAMSWEAYRYNKHWAYGSSAERLQLLEVM